MYIKDNVPDSDLDVFLRARFLLSVRCSQAKMTERYAAPVGEEADRKIAHRLSSASVVSLDTAQQSVTRIVTEAGGRIQKSAANQNEKLRSMPRPSSGSPVHFGCDWRSG
jgi:hypothetical protein